MNEKRKNDIKKYWFYSPLSFVLWVVLSIGYFFVFFAFFRDYDWPYAGDEWILLLVYVGSYMVLTLYLLIMCCVPCHFAFCTHLC